MAGQEQDVVMDNGLFDDPPDDDVQILKGPTNRELAESKKEAGNKCFKNNNFSGAAKWYSEAIGLCPEAVYYGNRSLMYYKMSKLTESLDDATKSVELDPQYFKGYLRQSAVHILRGEAEKAEVALTRARKVCKKLSDKEKDDLKHEVERIGTMKNYQELMEKSLSRDDHRGTVYYCTQLSEMSPEATVYKIIKAEALVHQQKYHEAQSLISDVLRLESRNPEVFFVRGMTFYYLDNLEKASDHFKQTLKFNPDHTKASLMFKKLKLLRNKKEEGNQAFQAGKLEESINKYTEAMQIDSSNGLVNAKLYYNRGLAYSKKTPPNLSAALTDCSKAIQLDPSYTKAILKRGKLYMDSEMYEEAVRDYETIYRKDKSEANKRLLETAKVALKRSLHKDYYKILGVSKECSLDDIKKAYKKRAMIHHPDRHSNASEVERKEQEKKFKDLGEAYAVLSDTNKKARYDAGQDPTSDSNYGGVDPNDIFASFFAAGHPFGGTSFGFGPSSTRSGFNNFNYSQF